MTPPREVEEALEWAEKGDVRDEIKTLASALREAWEERDAANADRVELSRKLGELQGKYEAAHWPGIVEGWKERTEAAESRLEQSSKDAMSAGYGQGYEAAMGVASRRIDALEKVVEAAKKLMDGPWPELGSNYPEWAEWQTNVDELDGAVAAHSKPEGERA